MGRTGHLDERPQLVVDATHPPGSLPDRIGRRLDDAAAATWTAMLANHDRCPALAPHRRLGGLAQAEP